MGFITDVLIGFLMKLVPWLAAELMDWINDKAKKAAAEKEIDERLALLKKSYQVAADGTKMTAQQKEDLKYAIREFIKGGDKVVNSSGDDDKPKRVQTRSFRNRSMHRSPRS